MSAVHYEHFSDRAPLCWEMERIDSDEPLPAGMTRNENLVSCPDCLRYLNES